MRVLFKSIKSFWNINQSIGNDKDFLRMTYFFFHWKLIGKKIVRFNFVYKNKSFEFYCDNRVDLAVLGEIFVNKEYEYPYIEMGDSGEGKVILDLGANVGDTAIFYSILFPRAKIYAIEPNPHVYDKLVKNTQQFANIQICKCAISNTTGKISLNFGDSHLGSSINHRQQNKENVEVDMCSLEDFCVKEKINKIDILKFDIEGAEEYLLESEILKERKSVEVVQIVGEFHDDLVSRPLSLMIDDLKLKNINKKYISKNRYIVFGTF